MQIHDPHPTQYWHRLDNGRIQCDLCPHHCQLSEGSRGLCYVRGRHDNAIVLHSYGRSSGFCIDPIEKKPLNHFLPGTPVLSFGTAGCNLSCKFCQNWDISKSRQTDTLAAEASPALLARACRETGCRSIAYTYNDPVIFMEYAMDVAQACAAENIASVAVSAGYIDPEPRVEFFSYMDAANIDLKGFTETFYRRFCGGSLQPVLDTLRYLVHETNTWVEITYLIIPGANDDPGDIQAMCGWIESQLGPDVPLHLTAFHPDFKMRETPPTALQTLQQARAIAMEAGIRYVYTGNVTDAKSGSSYCHHCGQLIIERCHYTLGQWHLNPQGQCRYCGTSIPGRFEDLPGTWGARRQPVRFG